MESSDLLNDLKNLSRRRAEITNDITFASLKPTQQKKDKLTKDFDEYMEKMNSYRSRYIKDPAIKQDKEIVKLLAENDKFITEKSPEIKSIILK